MVIGYRQILTYLMKNLCLLVTGIFYLSVSWYGKPKYYENSDSKIDKNVDEDEERIWKINS